MATIVEQVECWYAAHQPTLSEHWRRIEIRSFASDHPIDGKVVIEGESPNAVMQVTFWNKGEVCAIALRLSNRKEVVLDDRRLSEGEEVGHLLETYFVKLTSV